MRIISHKHLNLHSASSEGGIVNVIAKIPRDVPDDVEDHPAFQWLVDDGTLKVIPPVEEIEEDEDEDEDEDDDTK